MTPSRRDDEENNSKRCVASLEKSPRSMDVPTSIFRQDSGRLGGSADVLDRFIALSADPVRLDGEWTGAALKP
jgi:hypothetical protein